MTNPLQSCLKPDDLNRYLSEQLNELEEAEILEHIDQCPKCQRAMEQLAADQAMWNGLKHHLSVKTDETTEIEDPRLVQLGEFLAPSDDPDYMGRWGAYEVCGIIGQGSTGIVLKCVEPKLNRFVAIKILSPTLASVGSARRRFEREGRAIAAVNHEHVVPIFAVNEFRGLPYIVMQYVPGVSLLQRIDAEGPLGTCEVVRVGLQVARGLSAAHGQGIIHRDVKPANVILEATVERAMVTDFGLARVADEATMTHSGTIAGTPQYMSPEQAKGEPVDVRSDLFSLGSLLYTACTARPPFRADTVYGIIHRVCETEPRAIAETNPDIAPWLIQFIRKLMSKQRVDRFESAQVVADLLEKELAYLQNPTAVQVPCRDWNVEENEKPGQVASESKRLEKPSVSAKSRWLKPALFISCIGMLGIAGLMLAGENGRKDIKRLLGIVPPTPIVNSPSGLGGGTPADPSNAAFAPVVSPSDEPLVTWTRDEDDDGITSTYQQRIEQAFEISDLDGLVLNAEVGNIELRQTELDYVSLITLRRIDASSQKEAEKIASYYELESKTDGDLTLTASVDESYRERLARSSNSNVTYGLGVPAGTRVELQTTRGGIRVYSFDGNVKADCQLGDFQSDRIEGNLWVRAQGGRIRVREVSGNLDALTLFGSLHIEGVQGEATLRASDGDIHVGQNAGSVSAHATGGNVFLNGLHTKTGAHVEVGNLFVFLDKAPATDCRLSVAGGNARITASSEAGFKLKMKGEFSTELTEQIDGGEFTFELTEDGWNVASIGDGEHEVELAASTGTVDVRLVRADLVRLSQESLGGSGDGGSPQVLGERALEMTSGEPRAGAMVAIPVADGGNIDGYTLYLPRSYQEGRTYPVIVYLQGGYGVGGPITNLNDWGLPRLIRNINELESQRDSLLLDTFIVISLHIDGGNYYDRPDVFEEILESVDEQYGVDRDRVYLTGLSRGGHGTWGLAERLPNTFAALVPVAGRDNIRDYSAFASMPIWISHNQEDPTIDWEQSDDAARGIESASKERFYRMDAPIPLDDQYLQEKRLFSQSTSDRHDAWTDLYSSEKLYLWLLEQSRN